MSNDVTHCPDCGCAILAKDIDSTHVCLSGFVKPNRRGGGKAVTLQFALRQRVRVKDIDRHGVVTAAMLDGEGWSYRVAYWDNSQRRTEWLLDFEIEEAKA